MFISTTRTVRLTNSATDEVDELISNHDEADTKLILHAAHAFQKYDLIVVRRVDTDVLAIAVHHVPGMKWEEKQQLLLLMGTGKHKH